MGLLHRFTLATRNTSDCEVCGISNETVEPITEPAFENYTFRDIEGGTELGVEMDSPDQYEVLFQHMWPRALQLLKAHCESHRS